MTDISMGSGKLDVGGVFSKALATFQSKLLFFVFTGLMIGVFSLVGADGVAPWSSSASC